MPIFFLSFFFLAFIFLNLFRAAPMSCGGFQARGVQSELQPPAYTTASATPDLSLVCDLHHSSQQRWTLNPPLEARDRTHTTT